ncbi:MAG: hypothetical protein EGR90_04025 [Lachnospiraceae bacterium]|nr:hypothetical protein [Lachnospiraceae bacterium]
MVLHLLVQQAIFQMFCKRRDMDLHRALWDCLTVVIHLLPAVVEVLIHQLLFPVQILMVVI